MKKGLLIAVSGLLTAAVLMGCAKLGGYAAQPDNAPAYQQRNNAVACENDTNDCNEISLAAGLVGQNIADAPAEHGSGTEYTTSDGGTVLGRIYSAELYGEPSTIYALTGDDGTIKSVSVWFECGETGVEAWQDRISGLTGAEMSEKPASEGSGIQSWCWRPDGFVYTLRLLNGVLTLDINAAVGELA